jgi:protein-tyrosine phosphatase
MNYPVGSSPPLEIIQRWVQLLVETFDKRAEEHPCIAIHCVAGLGR